MSLKAVLFDFNGVIINDEQIHEQLIAQLLIEENLRPKKGEFRQICLGRSDRACLGEILTRRGRFVSETHLTGLMVRKAQAYRQQVDALEKLPLYPGLDDAIFKFRSAQLKMGVVSGALRSEVELVLNRTQLAPHFTVTVTGDDLTTSKPQPDGYLLAVERLKQIYPDLELKASECLAIEDTPAGIQAAKRAGMQVLGVANTYPFHFLQRLCNWTVDYLSDLELDRVQQAFERKVPQPTATEC